MAEKSIDDWLDETRIDAADIPDDYAERYTAPRLRWSARKAQLLTQEYEKRGGDYYGDKDADQQSLADWTDQDWQTRGGAADAAAGEGMSRYLPEAAWALLQDADRDEAEATKQRVDADGGQVADWPEAVLRTMTELGHADGDAGLTKAYLQDRAAELDVEGRSSMSKGDLKEAIVRAYRFAQGHLERLSKDALYDRAQALGIEGRSTMAKADLIEAIKQAEGA